MGEESDFISVFDPVPSLTPRWRCTLRRAHVTLALTLTCVRSHTGQQDTHAHTYVCTQQPFKAPRSQGYQPSEGGRCLLSFEACFPSQ